MAADIVRHFRPPTRSDDVSVGSSRVVCFSCSWLLPSSCSSNAGGYRRCLYHRESSAAHLAHGPERIPVAHTGSCKKHGLTRRFGRRSRCLLFGPLADALRAARYSSGTPNRVAPDPRASLQRGLPNLTCVARFSLVQIFTSVADAQDVLLLRRQQQQRRLEAQEEPPAQHAPDGLADRPARPPAGNAHDRDYTRVGATHARAAQVSASSLVSPTSTVAHRPHTRAPAIYHELASDAADRTDGHVPPAAATERVIQESTLR